MGNVLWRAWPSFCPPESTHFRGRRGSFEVFGGREKPSQPCPNVTAVTAVTSVLRSDASSGLTETVSF